MTTDLALADVCGAWQALVPPNRIRISEGAAKNLRINRPGGASGPWNPLETPYMVEPVDMLGSRRHEAVCFVGPAQSGKTIGLGEGWLAHAVVNDPGDMLIVQMTQDKAREYSKQRIDRAIKNSPALAAMRSAMARDDNLHDKQFKNGMWLRVAWPTVTNLSSTSYRYVFGTDYDRWNQGKDDVDGEGAGFGLMKKRTTTFLSRGKTSVESSPGRPIVDPSWKPSTPHEAPPVGTPESGGGVLGIYNTGDRRRWYWKCPHCGDWLEAAPGLRLFSLDDDDQLLEDIRDIDIDTYARQHATVAHGACGALILPADREQMNRRGLWLPEGVTIDDRDRLSGTPRTSSIASYWLGGVAATYVTWFTLIQRHLQGLLAYSMSGDETALQLTANTDQSMPYMSRHLREAADAAARGKRYEHDMPRFIVPDWARFVVAAVDVQGGKNARFVVQVHAIGEHQRQAVIDRYAITMSRREGMGDEFAPIDPAAYAEDWDLLTEKVLKATYRTTNEDREVRVRLAGVDTGGEDGVTDNAYRWARRVRKAGLGSRLLLLKGVGTKSDWHVRETEVGGAQGSGDLKLYLLNSNLLKDAVWAGLQRRDPGPNYYHFPEPKSDTNPKGWVTQAFYDELHAEVRNENGVWEQIKPRNETFDCCQMIRGVCSVKGADRREFWTSPPGWALPLDAGNTEVVTPEQRRELQAEPLPAVTPADRKPRVKLERRARRSAYMG
jgi:phage terminase large subunit GpA-like protein